MGVGSTHGSTASYPNTQAFPRGPLRMTRSVLFPVVETNHKLDWVCPSQLRTMNKAGEQRKKEEEVEAEIQEGERETSQQEPRERRETER